MMEKLSIAVTATIQQSGGISWVNGGTIINCSNNGSIAANENAGGISGYSSGTITNCYNSGAINVTTSFIGGICGFTFGYSGTTNCYYLGTSTNSGIGGVSTDTEATISLSEGVMKGTGTIGSGTYSDKTLVEALNARAAEENINSTIT